MDGLHRARKFKGEEGTARVGCARLPSFRTRPRAERNPPEDSGTTAVAQEHGKQRYRVGFDLDAVIREYGVLRDIILGFIEEAGQPLPIPQWRVINQRISTAIPVAVCQYGEERQWQVNQHWELPQHRRHPSRLGQQPRRHCPCAADRGGTLLERMAEDLLDMSSLETRRDVPGLGLGLLYISKGGTLYMSVPRLTSTWLPIAFKWLSNPLEDSPRRSWTRPFASS